MSWHTLTDTLALSLVCSYCKAQPGQWCVTARGSHLGSRATWLHSGRTRQLWDLERRGYLYGQSAGLWQSVTLLERGGTVADLRAKAVQARIRSEESV